MQMIDELESLREPMTRWRRDLHAHPEIAFQEQRTADLVATRLESFGIEVHRGIARTGVVGKLRAGNSLRAIALRADMDALPIEEANDFAHRSRHAGRMHACGHDGHTAMLLGAACHLARTRRFNGCVYFIFQPAEESEGGGRLMVEEGLFERFPVEAVYGLHNWPGLPVGQFAVMPGPMMACSDGFEIRLLGRGTHAAMPHLGRDPVLAAAALVQALQSIASRRVSATDPVVLSVTQIHAGDTWNVIPAQATLRGTARAFTPAVQDQIEAALHEIAAGVAAAHGVSAEVEYLRRYPPTINSAPEAALAARVAAAVFGAANVHTDLAPTMGAEDFAFMLQKKPGAYAWIGNGGVEGGCILHNPRYDFNDAILPLGGAYWVHLAETILAAAA
jgi:hippurate hydrolase